MPFFVAAGSHVALVYFEPAMSPSLSPSIAHVLILFMRFYIYIYNVYIYI